MFVECFPSDFGPGVNILRMKWFLCVLYVASETRRWEILLFSIITPLNGRRKKDPHKCNAMHNTSSSSSSNKNIVCGYTVVANGTCVKLDKWHVQRKPFSVVIHRDLASNLMPSSSYKFHIKLLAVIKAKLMVQLITLQLKYGSMHLHKM